MTKKKVLQIAGTALAGVTLLAGAAFAGAQQYSGSQESQKLPVVGSVNAPLDVQSVSTKKQTEDRVTIHFKWSGPQPHVAYTNEKTGESTTKPGVPMKDEGNGWYSCTVPNADSVKMAISVPDVDYQTTEFTREDGEYWYDLNTGWYTKTPVNYEEPEIQKAQPADVSEKEITKEAASVAENSKITIHYPSDWDKTYIYAWNALPDDIEMDWPGEELEKDSNGYYSYAFDEKTKVNFLFTGDGNQTEDYTIKTAGEYWYSDGKWVEKEPGDTDEDTDTPTPTPEATKRPTKPVVPSEKQISVTRLFILQ